MAGESPAAVLVDENGNIVGVTTVSGIHRLEQRSVLTSPDGAKDVTVIDDIDTPELKRLLVETDFKPGATLQITTGQAQSTGSLAEPLVNGGSDDLVVDGSTTAVNFELVADPTNDVLLTSLRLVFSASFFDFDGDTFGKGGGVLPNGLLISIVADNGVFTADLMNLKVNEDFLRLLDFSISQAGTTDVMAATLPFGGRVILKAGSGDYLRVTVRDNISQGARGISYLTATAYGIVEDI